MLFHIGLAKTATTWLQRQVFPRLENCIYIGKLEDNSPDSLTKETLISKELYKIHLELWKPIYASNPYRARNSEHILDEYVALLGKELAQRLSNSDNSNYAILSDEAILEYTHYTGELNHYLLFRIINKLKEYLRNHCDLEPSILVTFREQASFLQSLYAYDYTHQKEHFSTLEKFLDHGIKNHHDAVFGVLWYDEIYSNLKELYQNTELLFVPFELIEKDPVSFLTKSIGHLGHTKFAELAESVSIRQENVNRDGEGANKLRENSFVSKITGNLSMKFKHIIPAEYKELVIKKRNLFIKRFGGVVVKGSVKINDNQRQLIEDLYRNSNTRLAKVISMDLSRLGYSVNKNSI